MIFDHIFTYLPTICISALVMCLSRSLSFSLVGFLKSLLLILLLSLKRSLYIVDSKFFFRWVFYKYIPPICGLPFYCLNNVFQMTTVFNFGKVTFINFTFIICESFFNQKNICLIQGQRYFLLYFILEVLLGSL